jgi:hypothetical protein
VPRAIDASHHTLKQKYGRSRVAWWGASGVSRGEAKGLVMRVRLPQRWLSSFPHHKVFKKLLIFSPLFCFGQLVPILLSIKDRTLLDQTAVKGRTRLHHRLALLKGERWAVFDLFVLNGFRTPPPADCVISSICWTTTTWRSQFSLWTSYKISSIDDCYQ